jgi:acetyl esterase/lipase
MTKRIGWMGWLLIIAALLVAALYGAWRYALATNAVALLDWADHQIGGTDGYRVALTGGRYGSDPAQRLEVLVPDQPAAQPRPVLVFFHGGSWDSGEPGDYHFIGRTFARAGYVVILPGYRLVPEGRYPAMLDDGAMALAWTRDHAAAHGGDPARVAVMGHSAGAYVAAMLGLERQWLGRAGVEDGFIKAVVGLSGPYDFFPWTSDSARNAFGHVAEPAQTQPITHARGDAAPMLLLNGDTDTTVRPRNSRALAKALGELGAKAEPVILAGLDHKDTVMKLAAPFSRDRQVLDPVLTFLAAQTAPSAPIHAPSS